MIFVAFYKHKKRVNNTHTLIQRTIDSMIRCVTRSPYSHCEIAIQKDSGQFECYSSSPRDGGVRVKTMRLPKDRWDLVCLDIKPDNLKQFYKQHQHKGYDLFGALFFYFGWHNKRRFFCSEFCAQALGLTHTLVSPKQLFILLTHKKRDYHA